MFGDSAKCAQVRAAIPNIHSVLDRAVAGNKGTADQGGYVVAASAPPSVTADFVNIGAHERSMM